MSLDAGLGITFASDETPTDVVVAVGTPSSLTRRVIAVVFVVAGPVLLVIAAVALFCALLVDLLTRRRLRYARVVAMAANYMALEWVGLVIAASLWIAAGFGVAMARPWSRRVHYRVQRWWGRSLLSAAKRWLRLRIEIQGLELVDSSPLIVASQHVSFFDALLPTAILDMRSSRPARHVLKRELAWDPCLGTFGHRHPNHFVARGGGEREAELEAIESLAATAGDEALVIFPEGTFFSEALAARVDSRLATEDPERHARLRLTRLLPPRPGGISALLRGRPVSNLVFVAHSGFEPFGSLRAIAENVPFTGPVKVRIWRVQATEVPTADDDRLRLVDRQWQAMNDWLVEEEM